MIIGPNLLVSLAELILMLVTVWVMIDAARRGLGGIATVLWGLLACLVPCLGLFAWLYFRPSLPSELTIPRRPRKRLKPHWESTDPTLCPACGGAITPETTICPSCGIHFGTPGLPIE